MQRNRKSRSKSPRRKAPQQRKTKPRKRGVAKSKNRPAPRPRNGQFWKSARKLLRRFSEGTFWLVYAFMNYTHVLHVRDVYELGLWVTAAGLVGGLVFLGFFELPRMLLSAALALAALAFAIGVVSRIFAKAAEWLEKLMTFRRKKKLKQRRKNEVSHPRRRRREAPTHHPPARPRSASYRRGRR